MRILRQTLGALTTGFASLRARRGRLLLTAAGFLIAGMTLVILLTIPAGMRRVAGNTGLADVAMVLSARATNEISSRISPGTAALIGTLPGVAHGPHGHVLAAPQFLADAKLRQAEGSLVTVQVRGVTPKFWQILAGAVRLTRGKRFGPGLDQLIVGGAATRRFVALVPGAQVPVHNAPWRVTGVFSAGGGMWGSELWTDIGALQAAYNAQGQISVIWVKLTSPAAFKTFDAAIKADPRMRAVKAWPQQGYYAGQIGFLTHFANVAIIGIAVVLGLGAILAIFNAVGMALAARRRETAVLRAIGFGRLGLALALLIEVLVVAIVCAGIALAIGWLVLNGQTVDSSSFGQALSFSMRVTPTVAWLVLVYLVLLGILSATWPIARAVCAPLPETLQSE
ncbi:MAG: ABC transporter permease [Rhodanobacteraceae bacterium]